MKHIFTPYSLAESNRLEFAFLGQFSVKTVGFSPKTRFSNGIAVRFAPCPISGQAPSSRQRLSARKITVDTVNRIKAMCNDLFEAHRIGSPNFTKQKSPDCSGDFLLFCISKRAFNRLAEGSVFTPLARGGLPFL